MSTREQRIEVFEDTQKWYQENEKLAAFIKKSIAGTRVYMEEDIPSLPVRGEATKDDVTMGHVTEDSAAKTEIAVTKSRTLEAAMRLRQEYPGKRIAVHNFASATNPGGGVVNGSSAQEECLCRCSTLYPTLTTSKLREEFYQFHRSRHDVRYTDACIYTPDVLVIKTDTDLPKRMPETQWCTVDVLTCAAPNLREKPNNPMNPGAGKTIRILDKELLELHKKRARHMLRIAAANGVDILVLGAFGCGAFQNNPSIVARAYKEIVSEFAGYFTRIEFAIYYPPQGSPNYDAFKRILG